MISIGEALQQRLLASQNGSIDERMKLEGKEYQKAWNDAVQHFQKRINQDRKNDKESSYPPMNFIATRQLLVAIRDIDDLRWFYKQCLAYSRKKDPRKVEVYTFSKCFFGSLKIRP